jgi:hypothetical protein
MPGSVIDLTGDSPPRIVPHNVLRRLGNNWRHPNRISRADLRRLRRRQQGRHTREMTAHRARLQRKKNNCKKKTCKPCTTPSKLKQLKNMR